jgi:beta-lactamase superfamily II metal-dependent hydrolase
MNRHRPETFRADIVVAGIPEQDEPLSDPLLNAIQPQAIIVADSRYPTTARASKALQERLRRRGVPVFFTHQCGSVHITLRQEGWRLQPFQGKMLNVPAATRTGSSGMLVE